MTRFSPTATAGRLLEGKTAFGTFRVEWDSAGNLISHSLAILCARCGGQHDMSRCPIPPDHDPEQERKRGGCCDPPKPA